MDKEFFTELGGTLLMTALFIVLGIVYTIHRRQKLYTPAEKRQIHTKNGNRTTAHIQKQDT